MRFALLSIDSRIYFAAGKLDIRTIDQPKTPAQLPTETAGEPDFGYLKTNPLWRITTMSTFSRSFH